ncbi:hypothetical protein V2A60_004535 [Cordyceps javanica]
MAALAAQSSRCSSSSTFVFLIGPSAKQYPIPSLLLAPLSPALAGMVSDSNTAFGTSCAYLPDCDTATFDRFVAFLHHGDFPSPLFEPVPRHRRPQSYRRQFLPPAPFHESPAVRRAFAQFAASRRYKFRQQRKQRQRRERRQRRRRRREGRLGYDNVWEQPAVDDAGAFALCAVARVYLLAARYGIAALQQLCLHKLHRLIVCVREIWDGVHFLRLCAVRDESPAPLRRLAFLYCLFHYADLERRPEFQAFVAEEYDFHIAVAGLIAQYKATDDGQSC